MMKCPSCEEPSNDQANFCRKCGTRLTVVDPDATSALTKRILNADTPFFPVSGKAVEPLPIKGDDQTRIYRECAEALAKHNENDLAIECWNKAIELEPTNAYFYVKRGFVYKQINTDLALADFDRAIELNPSLWIAYGQRANVLLGQGQKPIEDIMKTYEQTDDPTVRESSRALLQEFGVNLVD